MIARRVKSLLVAVFSLFCLAAGAQQPSVEGKDFHPEEGKGLDKEPSEKFDANEVIFGHVLDAHQFHFLSYKDAKGEEQHVGIYLPVILYSKARGLEAFSSAYFHHGETSYRNYLLVTPKYKEYLVSKHIYSEKEANALANESIIAIDDNGLPSQTVKVLDLSMTRNVVQMLIALVLLVWIMLSVARRYRAGHGVKTAPKGFQNALETVILFVRDDVARPNLGQKTDKYMPFLLTIFFFILINNIVGLIPGTANVTGNIAFTLVLGLISFVVILFSTNKHYWGHIFNPPVPGGVKPIMILVEMLGVFTKPFALIIRLFANMIAGHIIIICLISLIFIFGGLSHVAGWSFSPISIAFTVFIYFIEILVAFLQAYIFTNLSAVFIGQAMEGSHDDVDHHEDVVIV